MTHRTRVAAKLLAGDLINFMGFWRYPVVWHFSDRC